MGMTIAYIAAAVIYSLIGWFLLGIALPDAGIPQRLALWAAVSLVVGTDHMIRKALSSL